MASLKTGEVAEAAGVGIETIRFYEREKLIAEPPRSPSGYRAYPEDVVDRIRFIRQAKDLGFSLSEIRELLSLRVRSTGRCKAVKRKSEAKLIDIEAKIRSLQRIRRTLRKLVNDCDERAPTSACPILGAMEKDTAGSRGSRGGGRG